MARQQTAAASKRRFMTGLRVQFGVMEMTGDLFNPLKTNAGKEEKFRMACPTHALSGKAVGVEQQYSCLEDDEHGPFAPGDCSRAKEVSKTELILVDKDKVAAAKEESPIPKDLLALSVHNADDVLPYLVHVGKTYVFQSDGADSAFFAILHRILGDDGFVTTSNGRKVLLGEMLVRKEEKIMMLTKWNGQIVLAEMARPEDVDEFANVSTDADDKLVVLTKTLMDAATEDFVPSDWSKKVRERYAAVVAEAQGTTVTAKPSAPRQSQDLAAMLEAAIVAKTKGA